MLHLNESALETFERKNGRLFHRKLNRNTQQFDICGVNDQHPHYTIRCMYIWPVLSAEYGPTGYGCHSCSWSVKQGMLFFHCPRSRLTIWSRETGSAIPSRASPLNPHSKAQSIIIYLANAETLTTHPLLYFPFNPSPVAPVAQRYHATSDTLGREFNPGKRDFFHKKKLKNGNKNAQRVEND